MDRQDFIEKFNTVSADIDMKHIDEIISGTLSRLHDKYQDLDKHMLVISTMEESAEYTEALFQRMRGRVKDNYDILQEMGDVILGMLCISQIFGISNENIRKAINVKIEREAGRNELHKQGFETQ